MISAPDPAGIMGHSAVACLFHAAQPQRDRNAFPPVPRMEMRDNMSGRIFVPFLLLLLIGIVAGCNPFAPTVDTSVPEKSALISDQKTIEGVFVNLKYAYTFKDTTIYGGLLRQDFAFTYRDYDKVIDVTWGRDEEMRITQQLFQNASNLNLIWNNVVGISGDSLRTFVVRTFNLTVTFNPSDIVRVDGRASFDLRRETAAGAWRIATWKDESNF